MCATTPPALTPAVSPHPRGPPRISRYMRRLHGAPPGAPEREGADLGIACQPTLRPYSDAGCDRVHLPLTLLGARAQSPSGRPGSRSLSFCQDRGPGGRPPKNLTPSIKIFKKYGDSAHFNTGWSGGQAQKWVSIHATRARDHLVARGGMRLRTP